MNVIDILSSISKIAIIAFVITLGIIIYEIYLTLKKHKENLLQKDIKIPEFKQGKIDTAPKKTQLEKVKTSNNKEKNPFIITIAISIVVLIIGGFAIFQIYKDLQKNIKKEQPIEVVPVPSEIPTSTATKEGEIIQENEFNTQDEELPVEEGGLSATPSLTSQSPTVSSKIGAKEISESNITPKPTLSLVVTLKTTLAITPSPYLKGTTGEESGVLSDAGQKAVETPTISKMATSTGVLSPTAISSITAKASTSAVPSKLPKSGIYTPTIFIILLSFALIGFAFLL